MRRFAAALGLGLVLALPLIGPQPLRAAEIPHSARTSGASGLSGERLDIGLSGRGALIEGFTVPGRPGASATVLILGGLSGRDSSVSAARAALRSFRREPRGRRPFRLIVIPLANPDAAPLQFPPQGTAYRDHPESFALWRWIGVHAPDLVLVAGPDESGLAAALASHLAAEVGRIPARDGFDANGLLALRRETLQPSEAHLEIDRRRARSPLELAQELSAYYGHDFRQPIYIDAIALIAQLRLGHLKEVERLVEPFVDGSRNSLARPNSLVFAGHLIFGELARRTGDPRYTARVVAAANFGFDAGGRMKEAMPFHNGFSDSIFMGTAILAQAGALTGERKYFDMAARHVAFMQKLDLRPDGLYRHHPGTEVAWGRGNAFPAIGYALTLSDFPRNHPAFPRLLRAYRSLMARLLAFQEPDGMWRNVIDYPGAYREYSATAMIAFAMLRGIERGWLPRTRYQPAVQRAWQAILARSGPQGRLVNVCESTARASTLEDYLHRAAILGADPRGGAMALLLATEMSGSPAPRPAGAPEAAGTAGTAGPETMTAMVLSGGHLLLQSVPEPQPGAGEVRIEIRAAGVNPADWKMARRAGRMGPMPIFGRDASGIIDAVGPSVTGWKRGDAVIALVQPPHGAYAQYAVVPAEFIGPKPRRLTFAQAAGIPVAGITAWRSLIDVADLQRGQRVLIDGGAGGVGSAAVQIAKSRGAYVIATAATRNLAFLRSIGADEAIDYTAGPFERKVKDVDVVLATANLDDAIRAIATLKPGGILVSIVGRVPAERCAAARIRCAVPGSSGAQPATPYLRDVDRLADAGQYRVSVERVFPLSEAAEAWTLNERGHTRGKLILSIPH